MTCPALDRPVALRLSVTDHCQLRCVYCRTGAVEASPARSRPLEVASLVRFVAIAQARFGVEKVRLTGGEPLLRHDLVDLVGALASAGVADLALTTNGQRLSGLAAPLLHAGLRRVNVSLDSVSSSSFRAMARGGRPELTVSGIDEALRVGLRPLKLNAVILRGINDAEAEDLVTFALERGCELRFIELMPTGLSPEEFARRHVPAGELLERLGRSLQIDPLPEDRGSSSRRYSVRDRAGRTGVVGMIAPMSHRFCDGCRRLRLTADGALIGCLARKESWPIGELLREPGPTAERAVVEVMERALGCKRSSERFEPALRMSSIGG